MFTLRAVLEEVLGISNGWITVLYCTVLYCVGSEVLAELKLCTTSKFPFKHRAITESKFSPRKTGFNRIIMPEGFVAKTVSIIMGISGSKASIFPCQ